MSRRETRDGPGRGHGPRRPRRLPAAALAAMALIALLVTACGGSSGASATGGSKPEQRALAYAQCMRSHGVPNFPDPDSNGNFHIITTSEAPSSTSAGTGGRGGGNNQSATVIDASSPQVIAANHACNHLLNAGPQMNAAQEQHALGQLVKYAQCMRAHGVPNFRDPHTTSGGIGESSGIGFDMSGIDTKSPQYQAAEQACRSLASRAKG